jgi:hypothetical protein
MQDDDLTTTAASVGVVAPAPVRPTAKERTGMQHAVARLLDALAPERILSRAALPPSPIERHRTPRGCILQGARGALTISWFPDAGGEPPYGELSVVLWRGKVSRPGSTQRVLGAVVVREVVLHPVEREPGVWEWRAADGAVLATDALAALCSAML